MTFPPYNYDNTNNDDGAPSLPRSEVAAKLAVSVSTMWRGIRAGRLKVIRIGHLRRVTEADPTADLAVCRKR